MEKILNCYLYAKKSYGILSKGAIFLPFPVVCKRSFLKNAIFMC